MLLLIILYFMHWLHQAAFCLWCFNNSINKICKNLDPVEDARTQQTSPSLPPSPEPVKTDDPEAEPEPEPEPEPDPETQEANSEAEPITQQPQTTEKDDQRTNTQKDPEKVCGSKKKIFSISKSTFYEIKEKFEWEIQMCMSMKIFTNLSDKSVFFLSVPHTFVTRFSSNTPN